MYFSGLPLNKPLVSGLTFKQVFDLSMLLTFYQRKV